MALPHVLKQPAFARIATAVLLAITFYFFVVDCSQRELLDFSAYIQAAKSLARGENIYLSPYTVLDRWGREIQSYYYYPPLLAQFLSHFLTLDIEILKTLWCLGAFASIVATAFCVSEIISASWWAALSKMQRFLCCYFFIVCFEPIYWGISDGQVTALILFLLAAFLLLNLRGKEAASGICLALAVSIKMSPIILALGLLRFRRWRSLLSFTATIVAISALTSLAPGGLQILKDFSHSVFVVVQDDSRRGFVFNYVFDKAFLAPFGLEAAATWRWVIKFLLGISALAAVQVSPVTSKISELRVLATLVCFMIICSPILWFHHLSWAILPLFVLSCAKKKSHEERLKHSTVCLGIYFALSQVNLLQYHAMRQVPSLLHATTLLPGLLLLILAALSLRESRRADNF
jgi:hypothetical protein